MLSTQTHIINKQILEIHLDEREKAFRIQHQIRSLFDSDINAMLDDLCSDAARPDEYIQIDRLEIDVGAINYPGLKKELVEKVYQHFKTSLFDRVSAIRLENKIFRKARDADSDRNIRGSPPFLTANPEDRRISEVDYSLHLLHHFLQTGNLPWHQKTPALLPLENIFSILLQKAPENLKALLKHDLGPQISRLRLIYQFSDHLLNKVVALIKPEKGDRLHKWLKDLYTVGRISQPIDIANSPIRLNFWDKLLSKAQETHRRYLADEDIYRSFLEAAAAGHPGSDQAVPGLLKMAVGQLSQSKVSLESKLPELIKQQGIAIEADHLPGQKLARSFDSIMDGRKYPAQLDPTATDQFYDPAQRNLFPSGPEEKGPALSPKKQAFSEIDPLALKAGQITQPEQNSPAAETVSESLPILPTAGLQEIYIENAGLVILWPYLSNLFKHFNLLKEKNFIDDDDRAHAIHLLQYLATGELEAAEYALALNKLLCGWDMHMPLIKFLKLTDTEKIECRELLGAAISHWRALKKTSVDGLRNSFLIRPGLLVQQENRWLLRVEPRAHDLLLEQLPWGISMIKLSWMEKMLEVEWK